MKSYKSLNGKICSEVGYKHSDGKKALAFFTLHAGGFHNCRCFGDLASYVHREIKTGDLVNVEGYHQQSQSAGEVFMVNSLLVKGVAVAPKVTAIDDGVLQIMTDEMIASGYIKVQGRWRLKEECIEVDDVWMPKIEYLMKVFGEVRVNRMLRANIKSLLMNRFDAARYRIWLDAMVERANLHLETNKEKENAT